MCETVDDELSENFSLDSLECVENSPEPLELSPVADGKPFRSCVPFFIHDEEKEERIGNLSLKFGGKSEKLPWNCEIDETVLTSKGLQLNEDGSFSKSPRDCGQNDLPFVMSAPRVALIRRRRQEAKKNQPEVAGSDPAEAIRKGKFLRELSRLKASGNLTDSMKEALYYKYVGPELAAERVAVENFLAKVKELGGRGKGAGEEANKNRPDLLRLPAIEKPLRMSYFERYQKKNGFDPRSISLKGKRTIQDTVRSKFGDSSQESLSDVSSRFIAVEEDEEEEAFYQGMMMNGTGFRNSGSDYSDRGLEEMRTKKAVERKKEVKIAKGNPKTTKRSGKGSPNCGGLSPLGVSCSGRKSGHSCCTDREPLPKGELASKARAYGNLANTRNIVKMKLKSFRRDWERPPEAGKSRSKCESFLPRLGEGMFGVGEIL